MASCFVVLISIVPAGAGLTTRSGPVRVAAEAGRVKRGLRVSPGWIPVDVGLDVQVRAALLRVVLPLRYAIRNTRSACHARAATRDA
jgi:hypothetical protein